MYRGCSTYGWIDASSDIGPNFCDNQNCYSCRHHEEIFDKVMKESFMTTKNKLFNKNGDDEVSNM